MTIVNLGSINWDRVFRVPHFPAPGETLAARSGSTGLGGKGLNQSVALHRSGGRVVHLGAVGAADQTMLAAIAGLGLTTDAIARVDGVETGSALILVDDAGENLIVLDAGANRRQDSALIQRIVGACGPGDWLLAQNETDGHATAFAAARARGLKIALAAAPFEAAAVIPLLPALDLLSVNEVEHAQLLAALGQPLATVHPGLSVLLSRGAAGASLLQPGGQIDVPALKVQVVDTTGAGDTALGAYLAQTDLGAPAPQALRYAMAAAALQVTRPGAAEVIPTQAEVLALLEAQA